MVSFNIRALLLFSTFLIIAPYAYANEYVYIPNIDPHTRYNNMREDCFYYYGYGSCNVSKKHCDVVSTGQNQWINLGDACNRNLPPILQYTKTANGRESQRLNLDAYCFDDDPVTLNITGWITQKTKFIDYDSAGLHIVKATCTDSFGITASGNILVEIENTNRPPTFISVTLA